MQMHDVIREVKKSLMAVVSSGGFKERDQGFGRSLADQVRTKDSLSPAQAYHALQMLHRGGYGQQIEKHGYKLPEIGALPAPVKKPIANGQKNLYQPQLQFDRNVVGSAKVTDKRIVLEIEKGDIASLLKTKVPESVWKEKDKYWLIPLSSASYLLNLGIKGIKLDPMIEKIVNKQKVLAEIGRATDCDFDVKLATGSLLGYQKAGVKYLELSGGRALLGDAMGLGKSQAVDSKILTPNGWARMGDIKVGDKVFGSDGKPHNVTGVFPQGLKDVYRVTFSDGSSTECCDEHLWQVNTPSRKYWGSPAFVMELRHFMDDLRDNSGNRKYFIPIIQPLEFDYKVLPLDPYLLGCLIGNGSLSIGCISFSSADEFTVKEISELLPEGIEIKHKKKYNYAIVKTKENNAYTNSVKSAVINMGLRHTANGKFIPDNYKYSSIEQRESLLQGLLDTDGSVTITKGCPVIEYVTVSKRLADDVQFLVESLGGRCVIGFKESPQYTYEGEVRHGQNAYRLNISFGPGINPFRIPRKTNKWTPRSKYTPTRAFESVEYVGKKECQCISVDAPDHLYVTDHCILTHNTLQSIAYLQEHPEIRPAIIVCPSSLKLNWGREIDKWMLDGKRKSYELISGRTTYPLSYADIYIINYDILGDWVDTLHSLDPKIVIGDEAHLVKNRDAGRTKAFKDLIDGIPHLILATGTPVMNRPVELWTLLNMVNPHAWGTFKEYASRYCNARLVSAGNGRKRLDVNGASNLEELHERSKPYIIRRLKEDVLTELPPKRRATVVIELSAKHKKLYQEAIGEVEKAINAPTGNAGKDYTNVLAKIEYAKQASAAGKLDCGAIQWIEDFLESGEKLIIFATHKFVVQAVMERFGKIAVSITGETKNEDRQKAVDAFQGDPKIRLFVGNIQAAGVGLTLTQASNVCFLELGAWTPGAFDQAEDRAWRLGQKNSVTCYYMVSENTIDMDIFELLEKKRMIIQKVVDNAEGELSFGVEQALIERIKSHSGVGRKTKQ